MSTKNSLNWYISQFPESLYPCVKDNIHAYVNTTIRGRAIMARSSVLICGIGRNIADALFYTIPRIETLGGMFKDYCVFIYENDSTDNTKAILNLWSQYNKGVVIQSENLGLNNLRGMEPERTERMAFCRNKYLDHAHSVDTFDYYIVVDLDIIGGWSYNGLANSFGSLNWDVIGSNSLIYKEIEGKQHRFHFDAWAYRAFGHKSTHPFFDANTLIYNRGEPLVSVYSCFGGVGIYTRNAFLYDAKYLSGDCDHPTRHFQLIDAGFKIYLNPSQITLYNKHEYCL